MRTACDMNGPITSAAIMATLSTGGILVKALLRARTSSPRRRLTPVCCYGSRVRAVGTGDAVLELCSVLCARPQNPNIMSQGFHIIPRRHDTGFDHCCAHFQVASTGRIQRVSLQHGNDTRFKRALRPLYTSHIQHL